MKKLILTLAIVLALTFTLSITAFAAKPTTLVGYFDNWMPYADPETYCLHTGEVYGQPDGFLTGCVVQPLVNGLGAHGTFTGWVDGKYGICEYNLRTFEIDGVARFVMNRCTGELAGLHLQGTGSALTGMWEGDYHFDP